MSASTLPTFHRYYDDFEVTPNFFAQSTDFDPTAAAACAGRDHSTVGR